MRRGSGDASGGAGSRGRTTRVRRTGIAVVHEGELIVAAEGSEAEVEEVGADRVTYYFPVEIEVREPSSEVNADELVARVLKLLSSGIRSI